MPRRSACKGSWRRTPSPACASRSRPVGSSSWSTRPAISGADQLSMAGGQAPDGASVLVVDDDDGMRSTVIDILHASGIGALGAPDAATAVDKAKSCRPAVALVDFRLPDAHGIELAAQLKALDADMSVV